VNDETLLERLIPGDLEHSIPAAVQRVLPGGFRNRLVQAALGLLIAVGLAFVVRRMVERREAKRVASPAPSAPQIRSSPELPSEQGVAQAMTEPTPTPAPAATLESARAESRASRYPLLASPHIVLHGPVDHDMYKSFRQQLANAPSSGSLVVSISSLGGDPEVARLMGDEIRLLREYTDREVLFLGKVAVYSAAATFMSAFPRDKRFLTRGTRVMIHERQLTKTINLSGPLRTCIASLQASLHEVEQSIDIEEEGFRDIVEGSKVSFDEVRERAPANWYIGAEEARDLGLILDVI
jgi:ATP-dependent protease ClpP protease subunit